MGRSTACLLALASCASSGLRVPYRNYYESVEREIGSQWKPLVAAAAKQRDPDGCRFSTVDRRAVVAFVVHRDGTVTDVMLQATCGVPYLDMVALGAVEIASPVPPPPVGLLSPDGTVRRSIALILEATKSRCERR